MRNKMKKTKITYEKHLIYEIPIVRPFFGSTTRPIEPDVGVNATKPQTAVYIQHYPWLRLNYLHGSPYSREVKE